MTWPLRFAFSLISSGEFGSSGTAAGCQALFPCWPGASKRLAIVKHDISKADQCRCLAQLLPPFSFQPPFMGSCLVREPLSYLSGLILVSGLRLKHSQRNWPTKEGYALAENVDKVVVTKQQLSSHSHCREPLILAHSLRAVILNRPVVARQRATKRSQAR